ncbi:DUF1851 domain-containing protein [Isoptericola sp. NEAU-Y5]|uniref:DUF1851 domain-containing protein n=1 Tax=Isoptericola luteus TaxID=2879484 RepID=A0ABS7ZAI9_9MICO|nr:T6SS immunity protein Tdi1 domain-containing protein [Isoptericola sp. NEAU-Y5]MCA5892076.1 DUF1851 domain-containing protein [Isoptericola sp. NEAU-Y5]
MELLRAFSPDAFAYGLTSWSWLGVHGKTPRFTTGFGDVFLESLEGWWFLDTIEGSLELRWPTAVDLYAELDSPDGRSDLLLEDVFREAHARGVVLRPDEVFAFSPHPAVGGRLHAEGVAAVRLELALRLTGDMHLALRREAGAVGDGLLLGHTSPPSGSVPAPEPDDSTAGWWARQP